MSRGRGRPAGMVEFAPEDEQCKDIACRIMENAPDAFKQQLQKDGANVFPASAKPAKTKLASRKQLEVAVQQITANLDKDVIFLHVVEIKMMLQLLAWRYPRLLEIMDIMQDHDMEEDVDVASMWGLEASFQVPKADELTARIAAEWKLEVAILQMQIERKRKLLVDKLVEIVQDVTDSEARCSQVSARLAYVEEPDYLADAAEVDAPSVDLELQAKNAEGKRTKKKKAAGSGATWTPYCVKPVKRKPCNLWVVWDRMQDKQCVQIRQDATPDVETLVRSWVDELNGGKLEVKVLVEATMYACFFRARHPSAKELLDPLHCIEFFAGENGSAKIAKCFKHLGCLVQAFDLSSETHNLDSAEGFLAGLFSVLRLRPGSFVHFGTVCTSFTWINSGTHGRRLWQPLGNEHLEYVARSRLLQRTVLLALLAWHMGAVFSIENPLGSWNIQVLGGEVFHSDELLDKALHGLSVGSGSQLSCMAPPVDQDDLETQLESMIDELDAPDDVDSNNKRKAGEAFAATASRAADGAK
ncbi:unnamed protein product, partial [Symbiodinium sp. KB8]